MVITIPLETAAGPGVIEFDVLDTEVRSGKLTRVEIPDQAARERFRYYLEGNRGGFPTSGGNFVPDNAREHLDVIDQILIRLVVEGIEGFDYEVHDPIPGSPDGDVER